MRSRVLGNAWYHGHSDEVIAMPTLGASNVGIGMLYYAHWNHKTRSGLDS